MKVVWLACFCVASLSAADFPSVEISNSSIRVKIHLPDPEKGSYRGTRFDWSGIIYSLTFKGHEYFGQWYEKHDPQIHDAITGPVEEYRTNDAGVGYDEAAAGGTFIRIGAGVVRKPQEVAYQRFHTYEIVDPGKWTMQAAGDHIDFVHELNGPNGYAYQYTKTLRLAKGKPELTLEHSLKNTGRRVIETDQYNHNFFVIDREVVGPAMTIQFAFAPKATADLKGLAGIEGNRIAYQRELEKGESVFTELEGFGASANDYDFRIENHKSGAGVRITGDQPLAKVAFWSIRTVACPEPYIKLRVEPGHEIKWRIAYEFYTIAP